MQVGGDCLAFLSGDFGAFDSKSFAYWSFFELSKDEFKQRSATYIFVGQRVRPRLIEATFRIAHQNVIEIRTCIGRKLVVRTNNDQGQFAAAQN